MPKILKIIIWLIVTLSLIEAMLRLQQKLRPIYDLEFKRVIYDSISDLYNHKNVTITYNRFGRRITRAYDSLGIRIDKLRPDFSQRKDALRVFFMGDSFMEGYGDANTIPQHIWEYLQNTEMRNAALDFLNAGCGSYSPAIFIPQAKYLIPIIKPDFVVIDIDETDLGDDYIRYKDLIVRDTAGKIIAVKCAPLMYAFYTGLLEIKKQSLYLARLFLKIIHTRIYMPIISWRYRRKDPRKTLLFSYDSDPKSRSKYAKEISFFENNLKELVETLINLMEERRRILLIYHPHLGHLKPGPRGHYWNNFVSEAIQSAADKYQVAFYNATDDLKKVFKAEPEKYYVPGDMHFTFTGLKIYGNSVAKRLLPMIEPLAKEKNKF